MTYVIGALILAYTGFIVYKKVKDIRAGKSCCSGCSGCPSREKCESNNRIKQFEIKKRK